MKYKNFFVAITLTAFGLMPALPTLAQETADGTEKVLVIIDDKKFTESDVRARLAPILARPEVTLENQYGYLIEQFILEELLNIAATKAGYESDPRVQEQIKRAAFSSVNQFYYEDQIEDSITDEELMDSYQERLDSINPSEEVSARHILLETKEEAIEIIKKLDDGGDFAALAKEFSIGPSKVRGGELGYFGKGRMVPEFEAAAFAMHKGMYSKEPVQTQFGFHVILLEDRREAPKPTFAEMREELLAAKRTEATKDLVARLNDSTTVQRFDLLGEPIEPQQ